MKHRIFFVIGFLLIVVTTLTGCYVGSRNRKDNEVLVRVHSHEHTATKRKKGIRMNHLIVEANGHRYIADFANNRSAKAFINKLKHGPVVVHAHDFENFEKVGDLPWSLPRSDQQITTQAGDVILYEGKYMVLYYGQNSWNFTRIARIKNVSSSEMHRALGEGNVSITYSLEK